MMVLTLLTKPHWDTLVRRIGDEEYLSQCVHTVRNNQ